MNPQRKGVVWLMQTERNAVINLDVQLLLMNLGAHELALKLLRRDAISNRQMPSRCLL